MTHFSIPQTDVVIVGSGPAGSVLALLLEKYGIRSILVEKQSSSQLMEHPRAHVVQARTLEILRDIEPALVTRVLEKVTLYTISPFIDVCSHIVMFVH